MRLQTLTDKYPSEVNKLLTKLVDEGLLVPNGHGRGTKYMLSEIFKNHDEMISQVVFRSDQEIHDSLYDFEETNDYYGKMEEILVKVRSKARLNKDEMDKIILDLCSIKELTLKELAELVNRNSDTIRKGYLSRLLKEGKLKLKFPDNINHPMQAYKAIQQ